MTLPLTPAVFAILRNIVAERVGIHYHDSDIDLFAERLSTRARELELTSLLDYYYHLRYDAAGSEEMQALVDTLVVNETYFFRESDQLMALASRVLPAVISRSRRARVWCAASSTGEEPYTLAMMLADRSMLDDVDIVATDICKRVVDRARAARFGGRSFRMFPAAGEPWFEPADAQGMRRVREEIRTHVTFGLANLIDPATYPPGPFDAILCRNVLIYFDDPTVAAVAAQLAETLRPDGLLLVGASESLLRFGTTLSCEEIGGAFFYRKPSP